MPVQYIDVPRVKSCLRSSYSGTDDVVLDTLLTACCSFLDYYCQRSSGGFSVQTYDELYSGTGENTLFLNNTPVQSIERLATIAQPALSVHNTDPDQGSRAWVVVNGNAPDQKNLNTQYTSTGITLTYIASNVTTVNTITWASLPTGTINDLVNAINLLGNHWQATVMGGFGTLYASDLRAGQGAFGARVVTAYLWIHYFDLPWYTVVNQNSGEIYSPMGFERGMAGNWRVIYTAGFGAFPDDLAQALAEITANAYYSRELNSSLSSEGLGGVSYSQMTPKLFEGLSIMSRNTLNRYKRRTVPKFSLW